MPLKPDYYYGKEAEQFCFYRIPKALFTEPCYQALSLEAKVLYGLLLDRMGLSVRNRKMDACGRVYIFFTMESALEMLNIGHNKAVRLFKELELIGLIERKKQGQGKPTVIYVKNFIPPETPNPGPPDDSGEPETPGDTPPAGYEPEGMDRADTGQVRDAASGEAATDEEPEVHAVDEEPEQDNGNGQHRNVSEQGRDSPPIETSQNGKSGLPTPADFPNPEVLTSQNGKSALPAGPDFPNPEVLTSLKNPYLQTVPTYFIIVAILGREWLYVEETIQITKTDAVG